MKSYVAIRGINGESITVEQHDDGYAIRIDMGPSFATASLSADGVRELVDQLIAVLTPDAPAELTDAQRAHTRLLAAEVAGLVATDPFLHSGQCATRAYLGRRQARDSITCPVCREEMGLRPLDV